MAGPVANSRQLVSTYKPNIRKEDVIKKSLGENVKIEMILARVFLTRDSHLIYLLSNTRCYRLLKILTRAASSSFLLNQPSTPTSSSSLYGTFFHTLRRTTVFIYIP
jgi:hypothetical protein